MRLLDSSRKTTLARLFLPEDRWLVQSPKWTVGDKVCLAGHYTGTAFDGADTVPYNGVAVAIQYWAVHLCRNVRFTVFDGDRFSYKGAKEQIAKWVPQCYCALIDDHSSGGAVAAARRAARGTTQNTTWVKGRTTKAERFYETFDQDHRILLEATDKPETSRMLIERALLGRRP